MKRCPSGVFSTSRRGGFTIVELITVVAVIAILMAILTPVVSSMMASARRSSDGSNLRQLAMATIAYMNEAGETKTLSFTSLNDWALKVSTAGNFNEATLFLVSGDPALSAVTTLPTKVQNSGVIDTTFAATPLSVAVAKSLNLNASAASTPVLWTRGLQASGSWASDSPYGVKGGFIAFLDGHVTFYKTVDTSAIDIPADTETLQRAE